LYDAHGEYSHHEQKRISNLTTVFVITNNRQNNQAENIRRSPSRIRIHHKSLLGFLPKRKSKVWRHNPLSVRVERFLLIFQPKFKKLMNLRKAQSSLPVFKYKEQILETIKNNQVTIIAGDTGCGEWSAKPGIRANFRRNSFWFCRKINAGTADRDQSRLQVDFQSSFNLRFHDICWRRTVTKSRVRSPDA
jgi:hypothetical protein